MSTLQQRMSELSQLVSKLLIQSRIRCEANHFFKHFLYKQTRSL